MVPNYAHQKELMQTRLDIKTCERMLQNIIDLGTNCSPFEALIIVDKAKEAFGVGEYSENRTLQPGQMVWLAVDRKEPAGKELKRCAMRRITITIHSKDDNEVYQKSGLAAKRQFQISRIATETKDQGALITQEDLSKVLGVDVKTIRRDIAALKKQGIIVPTRGQQKDIGPGVTHRELAVRLFLEGSEPLEIATRIKHTLKAVERYVDTFCRVVFCQSQVHNSLQTAMIVGISVCQVSTYLNIRDEYIKKPAYQERLEMIAKKGKSYWDQIDFKKNVSQLERRRK